ncbi:hypothetical protein APF79_05825 [bacterium BRH_c32]|nr:MAG: hypothetical protein APF79_05825 [bacterium BRH_c32]
MKTRLLILSLFFFLMFFKINAQTVGGGLLIGLPQGEFKENVDNAGFGLNVHGTLWSPSKARPFSVGLNLGYMVYGMTTERRPFSETNPDVSVEVSRTNSIANFHLLFLISPFQGTVRPYLEGLFGGAYISTSTDIKNESTGESIASSTNFDDLTWSYGAGGGLLIQVGKDMGDVSRLFLDLKARYIFGTEAEYLTEDGVEVRLGKVKYYPVKSKTDLIQISIGVTAFFN